MSDTESGTPKEKENETKTKTNKQKLISRIFPKHEILGYLAFLFIYFLSYVYTLHSNKFKNNLHVH